MPTLRYRLLVGIGNFKNFQRIYAGWMRASSRRRELHFVAFMTTKEYTRNGTNPTHIAVLCIGFIDSNNANLALFTTLITVKNRSAKKDLIRFRMSRWINNLSGLNTFIQKANAAINLTQSFFTIQIVTVFAAITVASRPSHNIHNIRTLNIH